jgi:hypothetical protein
VTKYCAFDIEIVKEIPEGCTDWRAIRPLGISCAATMCSGDPEPMKWYHHDDDGQPIEGAMTEDELSQLVDFLVMAYKLGAVPLTWNGLSFDFDVLAEESGRREDCVGLAMHHIDMMFQFFCVKGYMLGMQTTANGLGLQGKTEGMHGDLAPVMWAKSLDDRLKVLEYVGQDARTTLEIAEATEKQSGFKWISKSGKAQTFGLTEWMPVKDCIASIAKPDNAWMTNPKDRRDFFAWTGVSNE